jgi:ABC-2 type transport system permease protein
MIPGFHGFVATLRRVGTDSGALLLLVGAIGLYSVFYPLPYLEQVVRETPVGVVDLDRSSLSRQLVRWVDAHEAVQVTLRATEPAALEAAVQAGDISGYLVIPAGFRADVLRGRRAVVVYGGDADRFLVFKQVLGGLAEATGTLSAGVEVRRLQAAGQTAGQALVAQGPVTLRLRPLFNTRESYGAYLIPAVFMLLLQQTLLIGTGLIYGTDAARGGTRAAAGLSRLGQLGRFAGSCLALVALYAVHLAFYLGFCFWLFDVPRYGGMLPLAIFAGPFLLALVLFAQAIGGLCREREASIQLLLFTSIPFLFLAGFAWPLELMPPPVRWLAQLVPVTAGIQGFLRLNQMHADFAEIGRWWWTLWGLCLFYAWPAWRNWRRVYGAPDA